MLRPVSTGPESFRISLLREFDRRICQFRRRGQTGRRPRSQRPNIPLNSFRLHDIMPQTSPSPLSPGKPNPMNTHAPQRFNPMVADIATPLIPLAQSWLESYSGDRGPAIDLSQAVPGYPPHPDVLSELADAAGSTASAGYGLIEGEPALRTAYAKHLGETYATDVNPNEVQITSGCNQAFFATMMALAGPGDKVLMSNPCYFNHESTLAMLGVGIETFDCDASEGFVPSLAALEQALAKPGNERIRAVALVSPNNPTGAVYPAERLDAIADLCSKRGIWLVLDETYRDFLDVDFGAPHGLFARANWQQTFIQLYSFSKSFCIPGHRVGAVTAGKEAIEQIAKVMDNLQICAPRAPQIALARTLAPLAGWRASNTGEITARAAEFSKSIDHAVGWDIAALGAYFAYVRHPFEGRAARDVAEPLAREYGLLGLPGEFFGRGQERFLRLAFANVDVSTIQRIPERLNAMANT